MKIKVGVLFGGKTVEHEVSIISAMQAIAAFDEEKYEVIPIYVTKNSTMYSGIFMKDLDEYKNLDELLRKSYKVSLVNNNGVCQMIRYPKKLFTSEVVTDLDVIFPIVHGNNVEDGTVQGYLNLIDVPYVGPDITSSALGMDKYLTKLALKDKGLPVLDAKVYNINEDIDEIEKDIIKNIKLPVVIKPLNLGSSIGITKVREKEELEEALTYAFSFSEKVLVEKAIMNLREINCSVLGDFSEALASECEEPLNAVDILSYEDKYLGGKKGSKTSSKGMSSLVRKLPADITKKMKKEIQDLAIKSFHALGCSGVVRIDFMFDTKENKVYVNELNTIPGSLSFYLWEASGVNYSELIDKLISLALKKDREKKKIIYSFESNILSGVSLKGIKGSKGTKGKF